MQKTLLAALALSPGNKAITEIDEHQRLVVHQWWHGDQLRYSVYILDIMEGKTSYAPGWVLTPIGLEDWLGRRIVPDFGVIDCEEKRWLSLEESMREQGKAGISGMSGGLVRWEN